MAEKMLIVTHPISIQLLDWIAEEWGIRLDGTSKTERKMLTRKKASAIYRVAIRINKRKKYNKGESWYLVDTENMHLFKRNIYMNLEEA